MVLRQLRRAIFYCRILLYCKSTNDSWGLLLVEYITHILYMEDQNSQSGSIMWKSNSPQIQNVGVQLSIHAKQGFRFYSKRGIQGSGSWWKEVLKSSRGNFGARYRLDHFTGMRQVSTVLQWLWPFQEDRFQMLALSYSSLSPWHNKALASSSVLIGLPLLKWCEHLLASDFFVTAQVLKFLRSRTPRVGGKGSNMILRTASLAKAKGVFLLTKD